MYLFSCFLGLWAGGGGTDRKIESGASIGARKDRRVGIGTRAGKEKCGDEGGIGISTFDFGCLGTQKALI